MSLSHINGEAICTGDYKHIKNLVDIFYELQLVIYSGNDNNNINLSNNGDIEDNNLVPDFLHLQLNNDNLKVYYNLF